jgi:hypothetical protein
MNKYTIWTYWLGTDICLALSLLVRPDMLYAAMLIVIVHSLHMYTRSPHLFSFPMQVRLGYLGLLILGQLPYNGWIHWVQLAGTTALISVNYCPLARLLSLMPWNRHQLLSWQFVRKAIYSMPVNGSIIQHVSPEMVARLHPEMK